MQPDTDFEVVGALYVVEQMFNDNEINDNEINELKSLESVLLNPSTAVNDVNNSNALNKLIGKLHAYKNELPNASRTAKFWLQYLGYVDMLKTFLRAERTGNWSLHLSTIG